MVIDMDVSYWVPGVMMYRNRFIFPNRLLPGYYGFQELIVRQLNCLNWASRQHGIKQGLSSFSESTAAAEFDVCINSARSCPKNYRLKVQPDCTHRLPPHKHHQAEVVRAFQQIVPLVAVRTSLSWINGRFYKLPVQFNRNANRFWIYYLSRRVWDTPQSAATRC
jgi:hypothetical protein